ncbi:MAG TPA: NAD(P)-dependent alcohol dehydrogenase [Marmoricola sp.]|nr:NAD(P)-dependent alcohol dehydrogenase [Marmoricola sp.]
MTTTPIPATTPQSPPATMRAVVQDGYGSSDVLTLDRVPVPAPGKGEVLVRVHAAGLDRGTWHLMTGKPYLLRLAFGVRRPRNPVPGRDVAGTVVSVGDGVTRWSPGDRVYGVAPGSFAELAVTTADKLAPLPDGLTFEQAAVVPISGLTAQQAVTMAKVRPGDRVLVLGASGGVGSYAVQLAKAAGAEVTGVASAAKLDLVRSLGADHVLDYAKDDFASTGRRYDVVLDIGGNPSISRLRKALTRTGTAVIVGGEGGENLSGGMGRVLRGRLLSLFVHQHLTNFVNRESGADLERLTPLLESGAVTPAVDRVLPLAEAQAAMRLMETGQVRGKIALTVR